MALNPANAASDGATNSVPDGTYNFRVVPTYASGESLVTLPVRDVVIDNTAPRAHMLMPSSPLSGSAVVSAEVGDPAPQSGQLGSGVATVAFEARQQNSTARWTRIGT